MQAAGTEPVEVNYELQVTLAIINGISSIGRQYNTKNDPQDDVLRGDFCSILQGSDLSLQEKQVSCSGARLALRKAYTRAV